jgi:hypothetical protein
MTRPRKDHLTHIVQASPFLELPFEIREQIYYYVLVRPIPIDLWPLKYKQGPPNGPIFRLQEDLLYVRKEMATGLLTTCKQLYDEAGNIFWSRNTFRFSGDIEWFGARRFLGQIGPRALSQIQSLELFAPLADAHCLDTYSFHERYRNRILDFYTNAREAKNMPKTHMIKVQKQPWRGNFGDWHGRMILEHTVFVLTSNVRYVCHLMDMAKTSLDLKLVLPKGFGLNSVDGPFYGTSGRYMPLPEGGSYWVQDNDLQLPEDLSRLLPLLTRRLTLVIEAGATLHRLELPEQFTKIGINVLCQPGSFFRTSPSQRVATELSEVKLWMDPNSKFDYVFGVSTLFDEPEEISVAARGGRATSKSSPRSVSRVLRGFGGCRFVELNEWNCVCPPLRGDKSKHKRGTPPRIQDNHHQSEGQCSVNKRLEIKKKGRAVRNGIVNDKAPNEPEPILERAPEFEFNFCGTNNYDSD